MDLSKTAGIFILLLIVHVCNGGEYCGTSQKYCDDDCCGDGCCDGMTTATIVTLVIGALLGIASLAGCFICIFWMCKNASHDRHAVQPYRNSNSVFVNSTSYDHPRPVAPPSYSQHHGYPSQAAYPSYSAYNDPVYPPGMIQGNQQSEYHPPPPYTASSAKVNNRVD